MFQDSVKRVSSAINGDGDGQEFEDITEAIGGDVALAALRDCGFDEPLKIVTVGSTPLWAGVADLLLARAGEANRLRISSRK